MAAVVGNRNRMVIEQWEGHLRERTGTRDMMKQTKEEEEEE